MVVSSRNYADFDDSLVEALRRGDLVYFEKLLHSITPSDTASPVVPSPLSLNLNVFDADGWTMLHRCCITGKLELLKLLVDLGADVKMASRDGWNALHLAAYNGHRDIASFLLMSSSSGSVSNGGSPANTPPDSPMSNRSIDC